MKITVKKSKQEPPMYKHQTQGRKIGEWGRVKALHSKDNTVDITLATGIYLNNVPVVSKEWVVFSKDEENYNSGERDLPPVGTRVFILMPSGTYDDCFVMPFSNFSMINRMKLLLDDNKENVKERITPNGWHIIEDKINGIYKVLLPDNKASFEIDIETGDLIIESTGKITVNAPNVQITGGQLQVDGSSVSNGQGSFCGLPKCLFTGADHVSNIMTGT